MWLRCKVTPLLGLFHYSRSSHCEGDKLNTVIQKLVKGGAKLSVPAAWHIQNEFDSECVPMRRCIAHSPNMAQYMFWAVSPHFGNEFGWISTLGIRSCTVVGTHPRHRKMCVIHVKPR